MNSQASERPLDFEQLVREHSGRIRRIARRFATNGAVDDLVQDILTRLWRSYAGFRGDARVETWIYRVALNAAMTHQSEAVKARTLKAAVSARSAATEGAPARIEMEIEKLEKQQRLMNRVSYWFLLPMLIANGISLLGGHHSQTGSLVPDVPGMAIFATCGLAYGFTYWLVRREMKKWDPVLARLQRLRTDLLG